MFSEHLLTFSSTERPRRDCSRIWRGGASNEIKNAPLIRLPLNCGTHRFVWRHSFVRTVLSGAVPSSFHFSIAPSEPVLFSTTYGMPVVNYRDASGMTIG